MKNGRQAKSIRNFHIRRTYRIRTLVALLAVVGLPMASAYAEFTVWQTVVNNGDLIPQTDPSKNFNSYNQPSINDSGVAVFRARAQGGAGHGVFTRDMSVPNSPINVLAMRGEVVPDPNNITNPGPATYNEFPSFPRIDAASNTAAFRAQSTPSWLVTLPDGSETRSGTSGLYANPVGNTIITGIRNIEPEGGFPEYLVPNQSVPTRFEQFPGAPSPTGDIVAFKGNLTDSTGAGQTGVYFRDMVANAGNSNVVEVARRGMSIPTDAVPGGASAVFDSTAPPSAAGGSIVFTGLDNEEAPTAGGIFMAPLTSSPTLTTVAGFNTVVPQNGTNTLNAIGEGLSFDERFVGFWGAWGTETFEKQVMCPPDGNPDLIDACFAQDENGIPGDGIYTFEVPANQGIFLADTDLNELHLVAQTGDEYEDFLSFNFSGKPPETGGDTDAEPPRWRSSAFIAIDGNDVVFEALQYDGESGLFGALDVNDAFSASNLFTIITTGMDGGLIDPLAAGLPIVSLGIERDGFRNGRLAINASMATADEGWAGIYITSVPEPSTSALLALGLVGLAARRRRA